VDDHEPELVGERTAWSFPECAAIVLYACLAIEMFANAAYAIGSLDQEPGGLGPLFSMSTLTIVATTLSWLPLVGLGISTLFVFGALGFCYWQWLACIATKEQSTSHDHLARLKVLTWVGLVASILGVLGGIAMLIELGRLYRLPAGWALEANYYTTAVIATVIAALAAWGALLLIRRVNGALDPVEPVATAE
jgi:hypothetical protein